MAVILYSSSERESRRFIAQLPEGHGHKLIDWHRDLDARYTYEGPAPSAFPSVAIKQLNGDWALYRTPASVEECQQPEVLPESIAPRAAYIGGIKVQQAEQLLNNPNYPDKHKQPLRQKLLNLEVEFQNEKERILSEGKLGPAAKRKLEDADSLAALFERVQEARRSK